MFWVLLPAVSFALLFARAADEDPFLQLGNLPLDRDRAPLVLVEQAVLEATADPRQAADAELRLLTVLQSDAPIETKRFLCRQLYLVGSETSAPILGRLLSDPQLAHLARAALEAIPSFSAGAALRQALPTLRGDLLVGAINSLGERRDPASVPALIPQLRSRDAAVVQAAVVALGRIGRDPAWDLLRAVAGQYDPRLAEGVLVSITLAEDAKRRLDVTVVFDALLRCADALFKEGRTDRTTEILARVFEAAPVPRPQRVAALVSLTRAAPDRAVPLILKLLRGGDPVLQTAAAGQLSQLPVSSAAPIIALLEALPAAVQSRVIATLADRDDPSLLAPWLRASVSSDAGVRTAGLRALATQPGQSQIVQFLLSVAAGETEDSPTARTSLVRLQGPGVDSDLAAHLDQGQVAMRAEAARCLGLRGARQTTPRLLKAMHDANASVRFAALESLGMLGGEQELPSLLSHLANVSASAEQEVAARAVLGVARAIAATSREEARAATEQVRATVTTDAIRTEAGQILVELDPDPDARSPVP